MNRISKYIFGFIPLLALSACNDSFLYDGEGNCEKHYFVEYVFDMNMQYADAFASKVNSVSLYIFDEETGRLEAVYNESGDALKQPGYKMEIEVLPGKYELVAWCGLEGNEGHFTLPDDIEVREDAHCTMGRERDSEGNALQNNFLHPLFHGRISAEFPETESGEYTVTIPLVKDTNNINLSLQHVGGQSLTSDMFTVTMTEGNGHMAHDNTLIDDEDVIYSPWHVTDGNVDISGSRAEGEDTPLNFFKAEISTARLLADRSPRINIVDNATGNTVYSIPIIKWALQLRSEQHSGMEAQEYLDREDEYNVMLYLDNKEDKGWIAASIFINGWRVVTHDDTGMGFE